MNIMNQVILVIIIKLLANSTYGFKNRFISFFFGEVEMMCQENFKASIVKLYQIMNIPLTAAAFKADRTGSTIVIKNKQNVQSIFMIPRFGVASTGSG